MKKILLLIPALLVLSACQQSISYKKNLPVDDAVFKETDLIKKPVLIQEEIDEPLIPKRLPSSPELDDKLIHSSLSMETAPPPEEGMQDALESLEVDPPNKTKTIPDSESTPAENTLINNVSGTIKAEEVVFDRCGELSSFTNFVWYWTLMTELHKEHKFNHFDPILDDENISNTFKSKKINIGDITQVCASYKTGLVLVLLSGDNKGNGFHLYSYDRDTQLIEAEREDIAQDQAQWTLTPDSFGRRTGLEIALTGERVINRCTETGNFQYNYAKNYIRMTKKCSICPGDSQPICLNYEN